MHWDSFSSHPVIRQRDQVLAREARGLGLRPTLPLALCVPGEAPSPLWALISLLEKQKTHPR